MKILVFGAHADDAEIGMGGTIARYASMGNEVKIVCAIIPCESLQGEKANKSKQDRLLVEAKSPKKLASKIQFLVENKKLRKKLSQNALATMRDKFSENVMIDNLEKLFLGLVDNGR